MFMYLQSIRDREDRNKAATPKWKERVDMYRKNEEKDNHSSRELLRTSKTKDGDGPTKKSSIKKRSKKRLL